MKKAKFSKIIVLALSLALLIGSAIGIAVSAAGDDGNYQIESINVSHGDRTQVLVAVDAPSETDLGKTDPGLTVTYAIGAQAAKNATFYKYMQIAKDSEGNMTGPWYPVYYTPGIAIKDMGEDIIAKVYDPAKTDGSSAAGKNVCVAEYLYTKLYKEGYIAKTAADGEDYEQKALYLSMLDYIANAQEVLWNNKNPDDTKPLVTDRIYVYAQDAKVNGTENNSVLLTGKGSVTLTYTGSESIVGWKAYTYSDGAAEESVYTSNTVAVSAHTVFVPYVLPAGAVEDFEGDYTTTPVTWTYNEVNYEANNIAFPSGVTIDKTAQGNHSADVNAEIVTDGDNKYALLGADRSSVDKNRGHAMTVPAQQLVENAEKYVFEASMNVNAWNFSLNFYDSTGKSIKMYAGGANISSSAYFGSLFGTNQWVDVRFEFYLDTDKVAFFVKNTDGAYELKAICPISASLAYNATETLSLKDISYVWIGADSGSGKKVELKVDNVSLYSTVNVISTPTYEGFEGDYTSETVTWTFSYTGEAHSGEQFSATNLYFPSGISAAVESTNGSTTSYSNITGNTASVLDDGTGNRYLQIDSYRNGNNRDRGHSLKFTPAYMTANYNVYVFEGAVSANSNAWTMSFISSANVTSQFNPGISASALQAALNNSGEFVNVRMEVYLDVDVIQLYVEDVYVGNLGAGGDSSTKPLTDLADIATFSFAGGNGITARFDNVAFYATQKTYVENPNAAE